jgi:hypothetical protein
MAYDQSPNKGEKAMNRFAAIAVSLLLALAVPQARAALIQTEDLERERVKAMLERPEVQAEMQKMGVAPGEAAARIEAMTAEEVRSLAGRLDALPAGGARMTDQTLLLIIIIILLIAILI